MKDSRVVVITGASAGIGRTTVRAFAARGARIGLIARNAEALVNAQKEVEARGGEAVVAIADVSDADAVERAAQTIEAAFGPIDVWINNAMTSVIGPIREITPDEFRRVTEVTYLGVVH
jgi:NAD(P)-dependent dehydrogenase (short-subunit alcohol dehydrogenase family)